MPLVFLFLVPTIQYVIRDGKPKFCSPNDQVFAQVAHNQLWYIMEVIQATLI